MVDSTWILWIGNRESPSIRRQPPREFPRKTRRENLFCSLLSLPRPPHQQDKGTHKYPPATPSAGQGYPQVSCPTPPPRLGTDPDSLSGESHRGRADRNSAPA